MSVKYAVIFERAPNNWAAYVPDLPGCMTTGATLEETKENIKEGAQGHRSRRFWESWRNLIPGTGGQCALDFVVAEVIAPHKPIDRE